MAKVTQSPCTQIANLWPHTIWQPTFDHMTLYFNSWRWFLAIPAVEPCVGHNTGGSQWGWWGQPIGEESHHNQKLLRRPHRGEALPHEPCQCLRWHHHPCGELPARLVIQPWFDKLVGIILPWASQILPLFCRCITWVRGGNSEGRGKYLCVWVQWTHCTYTCSSTHIVSDFRSSFGVVSSTIIGLCYYLLKLSVLKHIFEA